jgi:hypothetical protein
MIVRGLGHVAVQDGIESELAAGPAHGGTDEATKGVDEQMTRQNLSVEFTGQDWVKMCHMLQNVAPCHLHGNQEGNNEHPGRKARANARALAILGRFVTAERQQQSERLRGIGARIQIWTAHGGVYSITMRSYRTAGSRRSQTTTAMMTNDRWLVEVILVCCRRGCHTWHTVIIKPITVFQSHIHIPSLSCAFVSRRPVHEKDVAVPSLLYV